MVMPFRGKGQHFFVFSQKGTRKGPHRVPFWWRGWQDRAPPTPWLLKWGAGWLVLAALIGPEATLTALALPAASEGPRGGCPEPRPGTSYH